MTLDNDALRVAWMAAEEARNVGDPVIASAIRAYLSALPAAAEKAEVANLTKERDERPKFIRCGRDLTINRNEVASVEWDRRMYMNGSSSWLVITMNDGRQHRIESTYGYYDSVDCSKIEKEIIGA